MWTFVENGGKKREVPEELDNSLIFEANFIYLFIIIF